MNPQPVWSRMPGTERKRNPSAARRRTARAERKQNPPAARRRTAEARLRWHPSAARALRPAPVRARSGGVSGVAKACPRLLGPRWRPMPPRCRASGAGRCRPGPAVSVGAGGWRRGALPCSCTPRFLVPGTPGGSTGRSTACGERSLRVVGPRRGRAVAGPQARPRLWRQPRQALPVAADRHPRRGRPCVRVTLRVDAGAAGTSPHLPRHLPGTSPYPAVIMSGRLRS